MTSDPADLRGRTNLGAYSVSILGLAALIPASGRMLPVRPSAVASTALRALAGRARTRGL